MIQFWPSLEVAEAISERTQPRVPSFKTVLQNEQAEDRSLVIGAPQLGQCADETLVPGSL
jgi:hypothetical protein